MPLLPSVSTPSSKRITLHWETVLTIIVALYLLAAGITSIALPIEWSAAAEAQATANGSNFKWEA